MHVINRLSFSCWINIIITISEQGILNLFYLHCIIFHINLLNICYKQMNTPTFNNNSYNNNNNNNKDFLF